jgi:hypothetical protein
MADNFTAGGRNFAADEDAAGRLHEWVKESAATDASQGTITVTSAGVTVVTASSGIRQSVLLRNTGTVAVEFSTTAGFTFGNGMPLKVDEIAVLQYGGAIYARAASTSGQIKFWDEWS